MAPFPALIALGWVKGSPVRLAVEDLGLPDHSFVAGPLGCLLGVEGNKSCCLPQLLVLRDSELDLLYPLDSQLLAKSLLSNPLEVLDGPP